MLSVSKRQKLERIANILRRDVIAMLAAAGSGHSAGPLGLAELFAALYFHILRHRPLDPLWSKRDRFILSCGHVCPIQYAALARSGYFPVNDLLKLRSIGSGLQGHPHRGSLPGVETTSGPLGQGISIAIGMALAAKLDNAPHTIYCLLSDGEHDEGQVWEALMLASKYHLSNLIVFIDRNRIQIGGDTESVMPLEPLVDKYRSFGWNTTAINGNDITEILVAAEQAKDLSNKPVAIVVNTIPGKGVSFMEGEAKWHGLPPDANQARQALEELTAKKAQRPIAVTR